MRIVLIPIAASLVLLGCLVATDVDAGTVVPMEIVEAPPEIDEPECVRDESFGPESPVALGLGEPGHGFVCPQEDRDWWSFEAPPGTALIRVSLALESGLSPIEPSYVLWSIGSDGGLLNSIAKPPPEQLGGPIDAVHCAGAGEFVIAVADSNDDASDFRREYTLELSTAPEPDTLEPNDTVEEATALQLGSTAQAWLSCAGDVDWYEVSAFAGEALDLQLETDGDVQPRIRVEDALGTPILDASAPAGRLERLIQLNGPGPHRIRITDDDGADADPELSYLLSVDTVVDLDPNEPNPTAALATALGDDPAVCGATWSQWRTIQGTLGAPGDNDWYRLPLSKCDRGVIDARLQGGGPGAVQPTLALVRPHAATPCTVDEECIALNQPCSGTWDCTGYFGTCLSEGSCAGAAACLQEGICGGTQIAQHGGNGTSFAAPLFGGEAVYLRVSDFQANDAAPGSVYTLKVRVQVDPDRFEPDNPYFPVLKKSIPTGQLIGQVKPVPVHDCTRENPTPDCCGDDDWTIGTIAYQNDIDWFRYSHPCPGENCLVRILWEADPGPVDFVLGVRHGGGLWFDGIIPPTEQAWHKARRGEFGGVGEGHECFYAFWSHGNAYRISVRDLATVRDFAPDQQYRFCVELVSNQCQSPCAKHPGGGCGP